MKVVDPGHVYKLDSLDGDEKQILRFVKREGANYPGNVGSHPGTTMQEVLRALIERCAYVDGQIPCAETKLAANLFRTAIFLFETRAARVHGRTLSLTDAAGIEDLPVCPGCGHIECPGHGAEG